jgi:excisionase family DNA binding protein
MNEKLWTVEEVAKHWRVSRFTIFRLIHAGRIEAISVGKAYRIPNEAAQKGVQESPGQHN